VIQFFLGGGSLLCLLRILFFAGAGALCNHLIDVSGLTIANGLLLTFSLIGGAINVAWLLLPTPRMRDDRSPDASRFLETEFDPGASRFLETEFDDAQ